MSLSYLLYLAMFLSVIDLQPKQAPISGETDMTQVEDRKRQAVKCLCRTTAACPVACSLLLLDVDEYAALRS